MHQEPVGLVIALPNMEYFVANFAQLNGRPIRRLGMDGVEATRRLCGVQQFGGANQIHVNGIGQMFDIAEEAHAAEGPIRAGHKSAME